MGLSRRKEPAFRTEAEMCAAFIAAATAPPKRGPKVPQWVAYAETQGWDILLVRPADGCQIGIEAKLRFGLDVVNQAIEKREGHWHQVGPDFRAVLVPEFGAPNGLSDICAYVGITVIRMRAPYPPGGYGPPFDPHLPEIVHGFEYPAGSSWFDLCPIERHKLPEYVPDVAAGASGPIQLTDWKIRAIKIAVILELRGSVTRGDFKALKIDHRRWLSQDWLCITDTGWRAHRMPDFRAQHPIVYEQIAADADKWLPAALPLVRQGALL